MTVVIPLALVALAATVLLVAAGREALRIGGTPAQPVRRPAELLPLVRHGWTALNAASAEATRLRMTRGHW